MYISEGYYSFVHIWYWLLMVPLCWPNWTRDLNKADNFHIHIHEMNSKNSVEAQQRLASRD